MQFVVDHLAFFLPILLLSFPFILKIMVDREVNAPNVIKALCELPVDMILLCISFLVALVLSKEAGHDQAIFYFVTFFILAMVIVYLSRRSIKLFEGAKYWTWFLLLILNFSVALVCLVGSVTFAIHHPPQQSPPPVTTTTSKPAEHAQH